MLPRAWTTLSRMSDTSHRSSGINSLYMTEGDNMGLGLLLSCRSKTSNDSGEEERWGSDKSGDTQRKPA